MSEPEDREKTKRSIQLYPLINATCLDLPSDTMLKDGRSNSFNQGRDRAAI